LKFPFTSKQPTDIEALEIENFAWIDFMWSNLGRSGDAGQIVNQIYNSVKTPQLCDKFLDLDKFSKNLSMNLPFLPRRLKQILKRIPNKYGCRVTTGFFTMLLKPFLKHIAIPYLNRSLETQNEESSLIQLKQLSWPLIESDLQDEFVFNWMGIENKGNPYQESLVYFLIDKSFICKQLGNNKTKKDKIIRDILRRATFKKANNDKMLQISTVKEGINPHKDYSNYRQFIIQEMMRDVVYELKLELILDERNEVTLELGDGKPIKFIVKDEYNEKNIYYKNMSKEVRLKSIIYGHTHKPREWPLVVPGVADPIDVYNTGGWIVNHTDIDKNFGASIVLMDDNLNLVSLLVYREDGLDEILVSTNKQNEFYNNVKRRIERSPNCWNNLIKSAKDLHDKKLKALNNKPNPKELTENNLFNNP
jgi:hypothetical protein